MSEQERTAGVVQCRTSAFQADDVGSIPTTCSKLKQLTNYKVCRLFFILQKLSKIIEMNFDNSLRSQFATLNENIGRGKHRKYLPYVFTEQGIAMLSGLLENDIAIQVSINIMNAFVEMRKFLMLNGQVFERLISYPKSC